MQAIQFILNGLLFLGFLLAAGCVAIVVWAVVTYVRRKK